MRRDILFIVKKIMVVFILLLVSSCNFPIPKTVKPITVSELKKFTAEHHLWSVYYNGVFICYLGMLQTHHDYTKYYPRVWSDDDSFDSFEPFVTENSQEAALAAGLQYIKEKVEALEGK